MILLPRRVPGKTTCRLLGSMVAYEYRGIGWGSGSSSLFAVLAWSENFPQSFVFLSWEGFSTYFPPIWPFGNSCLYFLFLI